MAEAKRYAVVIQLRRTASIENSFPMEGRAMFTEDMPKDGRKAAKVVTGEANLLVTSSMLTHCFMGNLNKAITADDSK